MTSFSIHCAIHPTQTSFRVALHPSIVYPFLSRLSRSPGTYYTLVHSDGTSSYRQLLLNVGILNVSCRSQLTQNVIMGTVIVLSLYQMVQ